MFEENCIVCVIKRTLWYTSFCGTPPFYLECIHEGEDTKIVIRNSAIRTFTCFTSLIILIAAFIYYAILISNIIANRDIGKLIYNIIYISNIIRPLSEILCCRYKARYYKAAILLTAQYLKKWKLQLQEPLFQKRDCLQDKITSLCCFGYLIFLILAIMLIDVYSDKSTATLINITTYGFLYIEMMLILNFLLLLCVYIKLLFNFQKIVMKKLTERIAYTSMENETNKSYIIKLLRNYRLIVGMGVKINTLFGKFLSPVLLILLLLGTVLNINCGLGTIYGLLYSNEYSLEQLVVELELFISFVLVFLTFGATEKLTTLHYDILSFLYKFPISKLHREEAIEVETTIKLLTRQKIEIRISEVFSPGLQMVGSYIGTVLTYVLVAIQFVKDWKN